MERKIQQYSLVKANDKLAIIESVSEETLYLISPTDRWYDKTHNVVLVEDSHHWRRVLKMGSYVALFRQTTRSWGYDVTYLMDTMEEMLSPEFVNDKHQYIVDLIKSGHQEGLITFREHQELMNFFANLELA